MDIPSLTIGSFTARLPIIQGGMGVRISLSSLASAVANAGGIGTISSIGLGDLNNARRNYAKVSCEALETEIHKAQSMTDGILAVNIMGVLSNADDLVKTAVEAGIKMIAFGAGLPTKLPKIVGDMGTAIVPIISSARVTSLILRTFKKRYGRTVDAFILEGPLAGGHLGYSNAELDNIDNYSLDILLPQILETIKPYEDEFGKAIPVIVGGGIYTGADIGHMLEKGASGVQMGTRFVATHESDVSDAFKQSYVDVLEKDIVITKSPVGMPGRAINNDFLKELEAKGSVKVTCPYRCLTVCKADKARYCIAQALLQSYEGDVDNGLIFCGQNAWRVDKIVAVQELMDELVDGLKNAPA